MRDTHSRARLVASVVALAGGSLAAGCGGSAPGDKAGGPETDATVVLTLANMDADPTNIDSPDFVAAVEHLSGGALRIDVKHGWRSDSSAEEVEKDTIDDVRAGKVDLAVIPARAWDTVGVESFQALLAPFLVDSVDFERQVLESDIATRMLEGVEPLGLVGVTVLPGALRYPLGVSAALVRPADYEGATIGIRPSELAELTFRQLGAEPEVFEPGSVSGLDGAELDPVTIASNRYEEQAAALTGNMVLWPRAMTIVMNRKAFETLSGEQQDVLLRAGRDAIEGVIGRFADHDGLLHRVCDSDSFVLATATADDLQRFQLAVQPVYEELERNAVVHELITEVRAMRNRELFTGQESLSCPEDTASTSTAGDAARELAGQWTATLSRDELLGAGVLDPELAAQAAGGWTLQFEGESVRVHNPTAGLPPATGRYSVDGEVLTIVWDQGIEIPQGLETVFGWSVYRDSLTLSAVPDGDPLLALTIKAWKRGG